MINITDISGIIANTGFPIMAFLLMYKFATDTVKKQTQAIEKLTELINGLRRK